MHKSIGTQERILALLDLVKRPIAINKVVLYLGDPNDFINLNIVQLLRSKDIEIITREGVNYISKTIRKNSGIYKFEDNLALTL